MFALCGGATRALAVDTLSITAPPAMTVTADQLCPQGDCAQVNYTFTVSGGYPPYNLICTPLYSGSLFPVGSYNVRCLAQDSRGNSTPEAGFTLTVNPPGTGGGGSGTGIGSGGSGTGVGGTGTGGAGGGGSGTGSSSGSSASASGSPSGESGENQTTASEVSLAGGAPRVGHVLTAHISNGKPTHYLWQLKQGGTWRPLVHQTTARLLVKATYTGFRLRVRVTLSSGRVLLSPATSPVHA